MGPPPPHRRRRTPSPAALEPPADTDENADASADAVGRPRAPKRRRLDSDGGSSGGAAVAGVGVTPLAGSSATAEQPPCVGLVDVITVVHRWLKWVLLSRDMRSSPTIGRSELEGKARLAIELYNCDGSTHMTRCDIMCYCEGGAAMATVIEGAAAAGDATPSAAPWPVIDRVLACLHGGSFDLPVEGAGSGAPGFVPSARGFEGRVLYVDALKVGKQGKGVGTKLMRQLEWIAAQIGAGALVLDSVATAVGFYARLGYEWRRPDTGNLVNVGFPASDGLWAEAARGEWPERARLAVSCNTALPCNPEPLLRMQKLLAGAAGVTEMGRGVLALIDERRAKGVVRAEKAAARGAGSGGGAASGGGSEGAVGTG